MFSRLWMRIFRGHRLFEGEIGQDDGHQGREGGKQKRHVRAEGCRQSAAQRRADDESQAEGGENVAQGLGALLPPA